MTNPEFVHLHCRSWFSFLRGASPPEALAHAAHLCGHAHVALTDVNGTYGAVRFQQACRTYGINGIVGAEVMPSALLRRELDLKQRAQQAPSHAVVLLAKSLEGYANICRLLTWYHTSVPDALVLEQHRSFRQDTICIASYSAKLRELIAAGEDQVVLQWLRQLQAIYGQDLFVELTHHAVPSERLYSKRLQQLSQRAAIPTLATNSVKYATPEEAQRLDLLTCIRLGIALDEPHPARPLNRDAYFKPALATDALPIEAIQATLAVAEQCQCSLLKDQVQSPPARIPAEYTQREYLAKLCYSGLQAKYLTNRQAALSQLNDELSVIFDLGIEEFFLVVREVVEEAGRRGIRCAGRGSAANSVVAFLLGITGVDPLEHNLLFARFLHRGRKGTPDIDVDFDSERRDEIIAWIEDRFGIEHTAMTATLTVFRLRLALREVVKALGYPMKVVNEITKLVPRREPRDVREYEEALRRFLNGNDIELLLSLVEMLQDCPRHLGLHSGGMVLCRKPLPYYSPVQVSANGVKVVQFDKDDIEALGLIKLDVLGLRMLAALSEADTLVRRYHGGTSEIDALPLDDPSVYEYICSGRTLGLFQIESQGQMHLIASHQPECFHDLVCEIALFRPGPLQGGMVHPFVRRRAGVEPVTYDHPDLEPILADTYGVILFQEQILEIANQFAGMALDVADDFRSHMSKGRDAKKIEEMKALFFDGALRRGVEMQTVERVFEKVSNFVGYGFCRSHAAAFAKTVYLSAWFKLNYPAAYMAAIMQHHPGMYPLMTLEEEAKRMGVPVLPPDINLSAVRYELESTHPGLAIRKPITSIKGVSEETAQRLTWSRIERPFSSVDDILQRIVIKKDDLQSLARAGALDTLTGDSRRAVWETGIAVQRLHLFETDARLLRLPSVLPDEIPPLALLSARERVIWDLTTHNSSRLHPVALMRRTLADLNVQTIETCYRCSPPENADIKVTVAGTAMLKQRPPTAKGVMFVTLEDETGYIQVVAFQHIQEAYPELVRSPAMIVTGTLQAKGGWRGVVAHKLYPLEGSIGGYAGFANAQGGRDRLMLQEKIDEARQAG